MQRATFIHVLDPEARGPLFATRVLASLSSPEARLPACDSTVVANLQALHAAGQGARLIAGSVTRGDELTRRMLHMSAFKLVPRGALAFGTLIRASGFAVARGRGVAPERSGADARRVTRRKRLTKSRIRLFRPPLRFARLLLNHDLPPARGPSAGCRRA
jgi:hypothetical protein